MIKPSLILSLAFLTLPPGAARSGEPTSCGLEEVPAGQQMMCTPQITYDEDGEIVGASHATAH